MTRAEVIEDILAHAGMPLAEHILRVAARRVAHLTVRGYTLQHQITATHAYRLWQQAGRPGGRDWEFWFQAEKVNGKDF